MRRLLVAVLIATTLGACSRRRNEGEACEEHDDCRRELICRDRRCAVSETVYRQMANQSGVEVQGERPVATGGPGAVRVRKASGNDLAFAICGPNERLLGGWCDPVGTGTDNTSFTKASAVGYTAEDTIGARWRCQHTGEVVHAFAFCQVVEPAPAPAPAPPP